MKIQVTLRCECGTEIEEISDYVCDKEFPNVASHRHGRCEECNKPVICVCEGMPPHLHAEYN